MNPNNTPVTTKSLGNRPICTETCPDPRDITDHDIAQKQFNKIDSCAKRYTHLCKHDKSILPSEECAEGDECYNVLSYTDE